MFQRIMIPVDLLHKDKLEKALKIGADTARQYNSKVIYVGVVGPGPGELARNENEYSRMLAEFADNEARRFGIETTSKVKRCNDLTTDVDDALLESAIETGADLVVMQSHLPTLMDLVWPSNGGKIARSSDASVMLVRD